MSLGMLAKLLSAYALPLLLLTVQAANNKKGGKPGAVSGENLEGLLHPSDIPDSPHSNGFEPRKRTKGDSFNFGRVHAAMEHILERVPAGEIQQVPRELQDFAKHYKVNLLPPLSEQVIEQAMTDAATAAGLRMYPSPQKKYMARYREDPKAATEEFPEGKQSRGLRMLVVGSGMGTYELRALPMFLRIPISPYAIHEVVSVEEEAHLSNTGSTLIHHAIGEKHPDILRHLPLVPSERTPLTETLESLQDTYELPTFDLVVLSGGDRDEQTKQVKALVSTGAMHNGTVVSAHGPGAEHDATGRYLQDLGNRSFATQVHKLDDGSAAILSTYRVRLSHLEGWQVENGVYQMHKFCLHAVRTWVLLSLVARALRPQGDGPSIDTDRDRVLYFSPVGPSFRELTKKNVLHLVSSGAVDIFLAHFRLDVQEWRNLDWYNSSVKYSVSYKAPKPTYVLNELVNQQTFRLTGYRWFWVADDNIDFTHVDLINYVSLAGESGANIVQPAVEFDSEGIPSHEIVLAYTDAVELPNHKWSRSLYRYTDFVEVMSPMFSAEALHAAWKLYMPGLRSDFGMDQVWCRYVATQLASPASKSCAIIDAEHMFKMPHIQSYNFQDALAVEDLQMRRNAKYLQRSLDRDGTIKTGVAQLCRPAGDDPSLVQIRPKSWLSKAIPGSWKLVVAYFRCKLGYSFMAECHTNVRTVMTCLFFRSSAVVLLVVAPFLCWCLLKQVKSLTCVWSERNQSSLTEKRQIRAPYRHRPWSDMH